VTPHPFATVALVLLSFLAGLLFSRPKEPGHGVAGIILLSAALLYGLYCTP